MSNHLLRRTSSVYRRDGRIFFVERGIGVVQRGAVKDIPMLFPWYAATMLAIESNGVIALRLLRMASGGRAARSEADLMVSEKVDALVEACGSLCGGATPAMVVDRYRQHVAANAVRLAS